MMRINKFHKKFFVIFFNFILIAAIIGAGFFSEPQSVQAASYTFIQTNWNGGVTANNAVHPTNQSNWTQYSSSSAEIVTVSGGENLEIASTTASTTQTSDTQFNNGTFSNATTTGSGSSASVKLSKALHINEYTIGASTTIASVTVSSVTTNSNGTWTIAFSGTPNLARVFKNDKFTDSASKAWKVLSVAPGVYKIIVVDSEGNTPAVSAPATGAGTVGRWYASLSAWETGRQGDITATGRNAIERGLPYYDGAPDTTAVTIDGWTTDATHYIEIYVPLSERHRGKWETGKYRMEVSASGYTYVIYIKEENARVDGLQINITGTSSFEKTGILVQPPSNGDVRISNNVIRNQSSGSGVNRGIEAQFSVKVWNNIVFDQSDVGILFSYLNSSISYVYNNTVASSTTGIMQANNHTVTVKNNISYNNTDNYSGTFNAASANNLSGPSQTDAPGSNPVNGATVPFVATSTNDFHLEFRDGTGNPAMNAGTSTVSEIGFNTDIDSDTRSGAWDIGADDVGATLVMTHSIGSNASRDFATLQAWEDARDGVLTTRKVFKISGQSAAFSTSTSEMITGLTSNATGTYVIERATPSASETYMSLDNGGGTFQVGEVVQGSVSNATATISAILTTNGTIEKGEAYKDSTFTTGVTIDGSTTDANHYMWLTAEPGSRHTGVAGTGVRINTSGWDNNAIMPTNNYTAIDWMELNGTSSLSSEGVSSAGAYVTLRNMIIYNWSSSGVYVSGSNFAIQNSIIYSNQGNGLLVGGNSGSTYSMYNIALYNNGSYGIANSTGTRNVNNIIAIGDSLGDFAGTNYSISSSNNISSDSTAPGTGSLTSQATSSVKFVSTASDFIDLHIMDGSVAKDAGADLSATFKNDIDSAQDRSGTWDIGADEWFSSSPVYNSSGTFTSATIDFGGPVNLDTLTWNPTTQATSTTLNFRIATSSDGTTWNNPYVGSDGTANTSFATSGAATPSILNGNRYIRYRAYLSTADSAFTPQMDDITINYFNYATTSPYIISSPYNTNSANNVLGKIVWNATTTSGTEIRVQMRSAPNSGGVPGTWSLWCGYNSCDDADYFASSTNNVDLGAGHPLKNGNNDQWLQYKVIFISDGANTPTLGNISLNYAVNAPPEFDSNYGTNGITTSQISDFSDINWGKVIARYSIRDPDTTSGTTNPGYATPSFEYRLNASSSWTAITTNYLNSGATSTKAVSEVAYTATSTAIDASSTVAVWDARTQLGANTYSTSAQIRVTMNDNEIANNIGSSTSAVFILDTKTPSSSLTINSSVSNNLLTFNFSDDTNISYRLSTSTFSSATSTEVSWTDVSATSTNATTTFSLIGAPNEEVVYFQVKDIYGNTFSGSDVAPAIGSQNQSGINLRDVSNTETGQWQEFISWTPFTATSGAAFSSYQLYRSADGTNYSQLTTINSSSTNYYTDSSVASSTTYYYKVRFVDTDGDISEFSAPVNDYVDGQGGTDITAPLISNVQASEIQSNWAKITWTTDEYSDSKVEYSASAGVFTSSVSVNTIVASTTPHTVYLTGLTPNTTYYYRVKSKDVVNNEATDPTSGNGYSFATIGGPIITNVSCVEITDNSATIVWNTDKDAVSWVEYSVNSSLTTATTSPSIDFSNTTSTLYQQKISLTGLSQGTTYYLRVKSRDVSSNITMDNNNGSFYQCRTTNDTKPPVISNILTPLITDVAAVILWTTDERSTSQVEYGVASASTGNYASMTTRDNTLTISHITTLTGLTKLTKYYFRVKSYDMNVNSQTAVSDEQNFTTADEKQTITVYVSSGGGGGPKAEEKDITAPTISNIKAESTGAFEAIIGFETNKESLSFVEYGKTSGYGLSAGSSIYSRSHNLKLSGLKMGAEYHFKVKAVDKAGNSNYSEDQVFTTKYAAEALEDLITLENAAQFQEQLEGIIESVMPSLVPPVISSIEVKNIGENSATIEWRTNVPAYSSLDYTADKDYSIDKENSYIMEISQTETKTKIHRFEISNLSPSTIYHFQARSFSLPGVIAKSTDKTFVTKASLIKPEIARLGNTQVEIRWVTDLETSSFIGYRDLKTGKVGQVGDSNRVKNHSVLVENLLPDNSYEIKAFGYDINNNIVEGNPVTVKTKKDVAPPEISNIKIDNALLPGRSDRLQTVVSWLTNEPANSMVYFEEGVGIAETLTNKTGQDNEFTTDHIVIITTFKPSTAYRIKVASLDEANNASVSPMRTILTPRSAESVVDIITRNLQESFGFLRKLRR